MKTIFNSALVLMGLTLAACTSDATPAKISEIKPTMNVAQVEAILGRPYHIDQSETTGLRGEVFHYAGKGGEGQVVFLNDAVFKAQFVSEKKS